MHTGTGLYFLWTTAHLKQYWLALTGHQGKNQEPVSAVSVIKQKQD